MKGISSYLVRKLGRYAVFVVLTVSLVIVASWLQLLDIYPYLFLALAPVPIALLMAACALSFGIFFIRSPVPEGAVLSRAQAPALWAVWDAFAPHHRGKRVLVIDDAFNASIGEHRRWFGLFGRETTMTVGLPLLMALDEEAVRAVIAHEVGHAQFQHGSGGTNLHEFVVSFEMLFAYVDPETTISGRLADLLLSGWLGWIFAESRRVSRLNEFEADRYAVQLCGREAVARSLGLFMVTSHAIEERILKPIFAELPGAIRAPTPPLVRLRGRLSEITSGETIGAYAAEAFAKEEEPDPSHPSLAQSLANLGFSEMPELRPVTRSARDQLLPDAVFERLFAQFNEAWRERIDQHVVLE